MIEAFVIDFKLYIYFRRQNTIIVMKKDMEAENIKIQKYGNIRASPSASRNIFKISQQKYENIEICTRNPPIYLIFFNLW